MATVEETVRDLLGSFGSDAGAPIAAKWLDNRYKQLASRVRLRHLRETANIAVAVGAAVYDMPTDARWFGSAVYFDGSLKTQRVQLITYEELELWFPLRPATAGTPYYYAEKGLNAAATARSIEVYPPCITKTSATLNVMYWEIPADLSYDSTLPFDVEPSLLKEGAAIDLMRYEAAKAIRNGQSDVATLWGGQLATQEKRWENALLDLAVVDRGEREELQYLIQRARAR